MLRIYEILSFVQSVFVFDHPLCTLFCIFYCNRCLLIFPVKSMFSRTFCSFILYVCTQNFPAQM